MKPIKYLAILCTLAACAAFADVKLAPVFSDHAVLQRDTSTPVWGLADAGEKVTVEFKGQTATATADASGKWLVLLKNLSADANPAALTVSGKNKIVLDDVLVGDVWLCGGQSNMAFTVEKANNGAEEVANSANPLIRHNAAARASASEPQTEVAMSGWEVASPETTGRWTAAGYFAARDLQQRIGVPIGLLNISYGGTQVESWMSKDAIDANPRAQSVRERWKTHLENLPQLQEKYEAAHALWQKKRDAARAEGKKFTARAPRAPDGEGSRLEPSSLYNAMLYPSIPYAIAGIFWYQGEANAWRSAEYGDLIRGMIRQWRADFKQGDVPFVYVELANCRRNAKLDPDAVSWGYTREAQRAALSEPNTALASAVDIGESTDIHPKNKQEVGRRLALAARALKYGENVDFHGPEFAGCKFGGGKATVKFNHVKGLTLKPAEKSGFKLAGKDGVFHDAEAAVSGDTVVLKSAEVPNPAYVRYAFENDPVCPLYNGDGLPAQPFRTDSFSSNVQLMELP